MLRGVRARLLIGAALLAVAAAAPADAQALSLAADHPETGWIRLRVAGADGATVDLAERTAAGAQPLAQVKLAHGRAVVRHAAAWRCDQYTRSFTATAANPDGSTETAAAAVRTPSCGKRLALGARAVKHGRARSVQVRLVDRWGVGDAEASLCVIPPGRRLSCRSARIPAGRRQALLSYRAHGPGLWTVVMQTSWRQAATARAYVRPARRLRLLATGDSMIEIVDSYLKRGLAPRGAGVRSDARISTGISKPFLVDWPALARRQARTVRPDVTVVFLGANDGFPFGSTQCCGQDWVDAYATRVQAMMAAYSRQGRGLVYWLTLPAPRPAQWRSVYPAVNRAVRRAAAAFAGQVRVVDLAKVFTPGDRFRQSMTWQGRRENVRQGDGVHLSVAGSAIAATVIERALRRDGVIG